MSSTNIYWIINNFHYCTFLPDFLIKMWHLQLFWEIISCQALRIWMWESFQVKMIVVNIAKAPVQKKFDTTTILHFAQEYAPNTLLSHWSDNKFIKLHLQTIHRKESKLRKLHNFYINTVVIFMKNFEVVELKNIVYILTEIT